MTTITRRTALNRLLLGAGTLALGSTWPRLALAAAPTDRRLVVVVLRGGLDGLAAVPPVGDPAYEAARRDLALDPGGAGAVRKLDATFALHPALESLAGFWAKGELAILQAAASPYRERSHFDAQNVLENGTERKNGTTGWLNRALPALGVSEPSGALAVAQTVPLILQGEQPVSSWMPGVLPETDADFLARVQAMYAEDAMLRDALDQALQVREMAAMAGHDGADRKEMRQARGALNMAPLMKTAGTMLASATGARIAVIEADGWDTHANQGTTEGVLARRLRNLDQGLAAFATALGEAWARTAVVLVTEFGRTVAANGTGGTDHGTAGAAFLLGGAVKGGKVLGDWPGLAPAALHEGRDLRATSDLRALFKAALVEHMGVDEAAVTATVFPGTAAVAPLPGLFRA